MSPERLFREASFDPETTRAMGDAYEAACIGFHGGPDFHEMKMLIAEAIIEAAKLGERDPIKLCTFGLRALANIREQQNG